MSMRHVHGSVQEGDTLAWVKNQLDSLVTQARNEIVSHFEEGKSPEKLAAAQEILAQLRGALGMVEVRGASMLVQEMECLVIALNENSISDVTDVSELLFRAFLIIPDYLEQVQLRNRETPHVLLPIINDLRGARNVKPLSKKDLFFPSLDKVMAPVPEPLSGRLGMLHAQEVARRTRHLFQLALLGWFQDKDKASNSAKMQKILSVLYQTAKENKSRKLWWVVNAVLKSLNSGGVESNFVVKPLLSRVDRQIKSLIDHGEQVFSEKIPDEFMVSLLYYLAISKNEETIVSKVKRAFALSELIPDEAKLKELQQMISGPNAELLHTVASAVYEDLSEIKDSLEISVNSNTNDTASLEKIILKLGQIANTLTMLGLDEAKSWVIEEADVINEIVAGQEGATEKALMNMAGLMLNVDSSIENYISFRSSVSAKEEAQSVVTGARDQESDLSKLEQRKHIASMVNEAKSELNKLKDGLLDYIASPEDTTPLAQAPQYLDNLKGALAIVDAQDALGLLDAMRVYITQDIQTSHNTPKNDQLEGLADVVTGVEYYLQALGEGKREPQAFLETAKASVAILKIREDDVQSSSSVTPIPDRSGNINDQNHHDSTLEGSLESVVDDERLQDVDLQGISIKPSASLNNERDSANAEVSAGDKAQSSSGSQQRLPVLTGEVDQDILEIFIEEAQEELSNIEKLLPEWQSHTDDHEALLSIRRSFHTLKGSGRLVGATLLGEFAWAYEQLLNRVLDQNLPATQELIQELGKAMAIFPYLVQQLQGKKIPDIDPYIRISYARSLGNGELALGRRAGNE